VAFHRLASTYKVLPTDLLPLSPWELSLNLEIRGIGVDEDNKDAKRQIEAAAKR
jgi:hypothetical protein